MCATPMILVNGCFDPNDERWMVSFCSGWIASLLASCCERKDLCDPLSKRMFTSVSAFLYITVATAVFNKQALS